MHRDAAAVLLRWGGRVEGGRRVEGGEGGGGGGDGGVGGCGLGALPVNLAVAGATSTQVKRMLPY